MVEESKQGARQISRQSTNFSFNLNSMPRGQRNRLQEEEKAMLQFDRKNKTLIDYFVILGPTEPTLRKLIVELESNDNWKGEVEYKRLMEKLESESSASFNNYPGRSAS